MRLALDHLTVTDATPAELVRLAAHAGCAAICPFLEPMEVLSHLPQFALHNNSAAKHEMLAVLAETGVMLDIAYPFTLSGRSVPEDFMHGLETAASLDAWAVNVLVYDREPARRIEAFATFCALAEKFKLRVVLEFYPASQIRRLGDAIDLVRTVNAPGRVGVNVDLLHLVRSGDNVATLAAASPEWILYGQFCDAPLVQQAMTWEQEASRHRLLAGEGALDLGGFARALPPGCRASVELPRDEARMAGLPAAERARTAVDGVRRAIAAGS